MPKYNKPQYATTYQPGDSTISNEKFSKLAWLAKAANFFIVNKDFQAILINLRSQYEADALSPEGEAAARAILVNADTLEYRVNELYGKDPK